MVTPAVVRLPPPVGRLAAATAGLVLAAATILVIKATARWSTTYSGASGLGEAADLAAGLGLLAAGFVLASEWPNTGVRAALAGAAWLARDWVGWQDGPSLARSVAMVWAPLFLPLVLDIVLRIPEQRGTSRRSRWPALVSYAAVGAITVARVAVDDPRRDVNCWNNCTDNAFLVAAHPAAARALTQVGTVLEVAYGLGVLVVCAARLGRATPAARQRIGPALATAAFVGGSAIAHGIAVLRRPLEGPEFGASTALFQAAGWSTAAFALGLGWIAFRARLVRTAVARLATTLDSMPAPDALATALAGATGDPSLRIVYRRSDRDQLVDHRGRAIGIELAPEQVATTIASGDQEVAVVIHDRSTVAAAQLERAVGPGAALAFDNERLRAEQLAQLDELRASRARVVAAADAERRRLERNLHDGAQQRLMALSYDVRRLKEAAAEDPQVEALADRAGQQLSNALVRLRELAHGIYPAILAEGGLEPALWTLADTAPIAVELAELPDERFSLELEQTVYVLVATAVDHTARAGGKHVIVRVGRHADRVSVQIAGAADAVVVDVADRVGALGGEFTADGTTWRAVLPCG